MINSLFVIILERRPTSLVFELHDLNLPSDQTMDPWTATAMAARSNQPSILVQEALSALTRRASSCIIAPIRNALFILGFAVARNSHLQHSIANGARALLPLCPFIPCNYPSQTLTFATISPDEELGPGSSRRILGTGGDLCTNGQW
jgi:hypothetical protein